MPLSAEACSEGAQRRRAVTARYQVGVGLDGAGRQVGPLRESRLAALVRAAQRVRRSGKGCMAGLLQGRPGQGRASSFYEQQPTSFTV